MRITGGCEMSSILRPRFQLNWVTVLALNRLKASNLACHCGGVLWVLGDGCPLRIAIPDAAANCRFSPPPREAAFVDEIFRRTSGSG